MKQWQVLRTVFPEVITDNFEFTDSWLTFTGQPSCHHHSYKNCIKSKSINNHQIINAFSPVGVTGFEPATTRPPELSVYFLYFYI